MKNGTEIVSLNVIHNALPASLFGTSLFGENCWNKFRMAIFDHSEFFF